MDIPQFGALLRFIPANTQRFQTLLESCAEPVCDQHCSNLVATFDKYFRVAMKMSNIKRCYNVAATLFGNISSTSRYRFKACLGVPKHSGGATRTLSVHVHDNTGK